MNQLQQLEHIKLSDAFVEIKGMGGVSNKWAETGNCRFIDYMNAYKHLSIDVNDLPFATVKNLRQDTLQCGDVLFTSASEVPEECAIASEIEDEIEDGIFLDDHLFGLRLNSFYKGKVVKGYLKYFFRSDYFRSQIKQTVRGVTRFYIAKSNFMRLQIPLPPLAIQSRIVEILDHFTNLTANLTAELALRRKQFEHFREKLLSLDGVEGVEMKTLGEVCEFVNGFAFKSSLFRQSGSRIIRITNIDGVNINTNDSIYFDCNDYKEDLSKYIIKEGDIAIAMSGATTGKIGRYIDNDYSYINQRVGLFKPKKCLSVSFLYHFLLSKSYDIYLLAGGGAQPNLGSNSLMTKVKIPVPPLAVQQSIVAKLDKFTALIQNIENELALRQKQYEYYREKLLSFPSPSL